MKKPVHPGNEVDSRAVIPQASPNAQEPELLLKEASKEHQDSTHKNDSFSVLDVQCALLHQHTEGIKREDGEYCVYTQNEETGDVGHFTMTSEEILEYKHLNSYLTKDEAGEVAHLSFLATSYKPEYWYMEVFECFRRLYSSAALVFVTPGSATQAVVAFVVVTNESGILRTTVIFPLTKTVLTVSLAIKIEITPRVVFRSSILTNKIIT